MDTDVFQPVVEPLTGRELEILQLISRGYSNREIANELVVTQETVKWYNKQIYRKLGVNSRTKAVAEASKAGLFETTPEISPSPVFISEHNLPAQITSFIGREQELNDIKRLLKTARLLTLTGPGGSGKSRLALSAAAEVLDQFFGGVFLVDLAPIRDTQLVLSTIAGILGVQEVHGEPLIDTIKYALYGKRVLLLLDNFEQVIETAAYIPELLSASPDLKVLVTSREPLHIYGEQEYHVPSLSVPDLDSQESLQKLLGYESMQLFYQRAAAVKPNFKITIENVSTVAEICVRLDGLPLAIELAAARSKLFSPQVLLTRLESRLGTLTAVSRDVHPRLQTLRGTLDWSYELLDQSEKTLFARLAVFQGGRTLESIENVCGSGLPIDVLDGLESLIDKNLLYQEETLQGEPRFYMLETIHEYAHEKLAESGEFGGLKRQHGEYFADLAARAEDELFGPKQEHWFDRLRQENDNFRAALAWFLDGRDSLLGARIVWALCYFWYSEGHISEGLRWTERVINLGEEVLPRDLARVYITGAYLAFAQGDHGLGIFFGRQALQLSKESGDKLAQAWAFDGLGKQYSAFPEQIDEGISYLERGLALFRELDYTPGIKLALNGLGELERTIGNIDRAEELYRECLELSRASGDKRRIAIALSCLSSIAMHHDDYVQAEALELESLKMSIDLKAKYYIGLGLAGISGPIAMQGQTEQAAKLSGASESLLQSMGAKVQPADQVEIDRYLGIIREQLGEEAFQEALEAGKAMTFEEAIRFALGEDPA